MMDRCQLATLVKWAGTLKTRKRLQKVVYLLQAAGCKLGAEYTLHHYGPYSHDVASLTDEMVQAGLLCEEETPNVMAGTSFSYRLSEGAQQQLERLEQASGHQQRFGVLGKHKSLAKQLLEESDLPKLEFAATVAYLYAGRPDADWENAREAAAKFKRQKANSKTMRDAEQLAREVVNGG